MFDHERLDVYKAAIEFVLLVDEVVEHLPRGKSYLADLRSEFSNPPLSSIFNEKTLWYNAPQEL